MGGVLVPAFAGIREGKRGAVREPPLPRMLVRKENTLILTFSQDGRRDKRGGG